MFAYLVFYTYVSGSLSSCQQWNIKNAQKTDKYNDEN